MADVHGVFVADRGEAAVHFCGDATAVGAETFVGWPDVFVGVGFVEVFCDCEGVVDWVFE